MSLHLFGNGVGRGFVTGKVAIEQKHSHEIVKTSIRIKKLEDEVERYQQALSAVALKLEYNIDNLPVEAPAETVELIRIQQMILEDPFFSETVAEFIKKMKCNAEWALAESMKTAARAYESIDDVYLRHRKLDMEQVGQQILTELISQPDKRTDNNMAGVIFVCKDIAPNELIHFYQQGMVGLVCEQGSSYSHTSILAKSLHLPMLTGLEHASLWLDQHDEVIIDCERGLLLCQPGKALRALYQKRERQLGIERSKLQDVHKKKAITRDGQKITLLANLDFGHDVDDLQTEHIDGIGLFRTEFLFMNRDELPGEEEQFNIYSQVLDKMAGKPLTVRTLDLGSDKLLHTDTGFDDPLQKHSALGVRGLRLTLRNENLFLPQIRALLRASAFGPIRILLPMLTNAREIFQTRHIIETAREALIARGHLIAEDIPLGGMIETPAAAISTATLCKHLDFISIGTNDLIQYTLAVDRLDSQLDDLFDPMHPAVIQLLKSVIKSADKSGKEVSLCGEMAGDPAYTRLLLGLGLKTFSMPASRLARIKQLIQNSNTETCRQWASRIQRSSNPIRMQQALQELNSLAQ